MQNFATTGASSISAEEVVDSTAQAIVDGKQSTIPPPPPPPPPPPIANRCQQLSNIHRISVYFMSKSLSKNE